MRSSENDDFKRKAWYGNPQFFKFDAFGYG